MFQRRQKLTRPEAEQAIASPKPVRVSCLVDVTSNDDDRSVPSKVRCGRGKRMFELIGIFILVTIVVLSLTPWRPRGSVPINYPGWTRIPLIAFAVFAVGPSVLGLILHVLYLAGANFIPFIGPLERAPRLDAVLLDPLALTFGLWPFLALYSVTRDNLIRDRSSWRSVRMAMIVSVAAMSLPSTVLLVDTTLEMISSAPNAGQAMGSLFFMFFLPIPGVFGWFIGRGIAWMRY